MAATWRALRLTPSSGVPHLLVSIDVHAASYTIRLTDLANIWIEEMERRAICMRSWSENTVIDPSDTPENMIQFLSHLRSALDPSQPGHDQTSVHLSPTSISGAGEGDLTLKIICELPGLQPLEWPAHLKMAPASSIATGLVLPLVQAQQSYMRQLGLLTTLIHQKDSVLTKLLDKLEERGVGLDSVFTSLSSKRKLTRAAAESKVKGLAPFNKSKWETGEGNSQDSIDADSLLQTVFGAEGLVCSTPISAGACPQLDVWWKSFQPAMSMSIRASKENNLKAEPTPRLATPTGDDAEPKGKEEKNIENNSDDDFEVQVTPPHAKVRKGLDGHPSKSSKAAVPESDDVPPAARQEENSASPGSGTSSHQRATTSRIGLVGSKKHAVEKNLSTPEPDTNNENARAEDDGFETASDIDEDAAAPMAKSSSPSPPPPPTASPPYKNSLGRIGGKLPAAKETSVAEEGKASVASAPRQKIGLIGKKSSAESGSGSLPQPRGRGSGVDRAADVKRETSEERAARRREELKQDLEKKAAAGPSKKKRRF